MTYSNLDWQDDRACKDMPVSKFFPIHTSHIKAAVLVCVKCPVQKQCLSYAVTNCIEYGVWGATTEKQRLPMIRKYQRENGLQKTDMS